MPTIPLEKSGIARRRLLRQAKAPVLTERKSSRGRKDKLDDTQNLIELRSIIEGTKASVRIFARFAGLAPRTVYSYLAGKRPVPAVAVAAGRWASLVLGRPVKISGAEICSNLGFEDPGRPTDRKSVRGNHRGTTHNQKVRHLNYP
jgi:hypothetical protein